MEDKDIIALWRFYDDSLKQALVLNTKMQKTLPS
jgi:hypothetical protein